MQRANLRCLETTTCVPSAVTLLPYAQLSTWYLGITASKNRSHKTKRLSKHCHCVFWESHAQSHACLACNSAGLASAEPGTAVG